ncbi:hypothetical protein G6F57_015362 [Rhizopus arrhizus]|nr:hypothetical protein G6F57_015362 [Rhizopus arrhizus]
MPHRRWWPSALVSKRNIVTPMRASGEAAYTDQSTRSAQMTGVARAPVSTVTLGRQERIREPSSASNVLV